MPQFCYNCGKKGHIFNDCHFPVMSYGGIIYQLRDNQPYYLMVQRTYTPDFKEIIRGKFDLNDHEYITKLISRITIQEIEYIYTYEHQILYKNLLKFQKVKKNQVYYDRYQQAKNNYDQLLEGYAIPSSVDSPGRFIKFSKIVEENNPSYFMEPDWGFPKGRRNCNGDETDLQCAEREIFEETGLTNKDYQFKQDQNERIPKHEYSAKHDSKHEYSAKHDSKPEYSAKHDTKPEYPTKHDSKSESNNTKAPSNFYVTEVHVGSNSVKYAHRYYVAEVKSGVTCFIDPFNKYQAGEIRKIGWFPINLALSMIRPYHFEKKKVLSRAHKEITGETVFVNPPEDYRNPQNENDHPPHILPTPT